MNRITVLREAKNWTQDELAHALNVSRQTISNYEREERGIDSQKICRLCEIFGCTADYLLGLSDLPAYDLTPEEVLLLRAWRNCDIDTKAGLALILKPFWKEASEGKAI